MATKLYALSFTQKPTYLHVTVTGTNSRETVLEYLQELHAVCAARGASRILIEERLEGPRLTTFDVFDIASEGSERAARMFSAIAYVDVNAGHMMPFAETVAVNRGLPVRVFASVDDAEKWLLEGKTG